MGNSDFLKPFCYPKTILGPRPISYPGSAPDLYS